jgi:ferredoxin-NADP reductase
LTPVIFPMLWTYLGAALILLVIVRLAFGFVVRLLQVRANARRQALEFAQFEENLALIRAQRRLLVETPLSWNGFRKFVVRRKVLECPNVCSFFLAPHDTKPLPAFKPGQYLTFRLPNPLGGGPLVRCYSLSDRPHTDYYRVTVKRASVDSPNGPVGGLSSSYFHDRIKEGDIVDVRAPAGNFYLEPSDADPVVLIAGGIGLTPIYSMLATLVHQRSRRPIWVFYGLRNRHDHVFKQELAILARDNPHLNIRVCYSRWGSNDEHGEDYHIQGRVTVELLRRTLPSNNFRFYYCGPGPMMEAMTAGLKDWGVPENHLHFEAFGAASVQLVSQAAAVAEPTAIATATVTFRKSGMTQTWDGTQGSLLALAEQAGIAISSGCRAGNCGTCVVALHAGEVGYVHPPGVPLEARTCLTCLAHPKGDITLDA